MSARAYVDQRVDNVVRATAAATSAVEHWGFSDPEVLRCGMNAIYRCGDVVLRVATPTAPALVSIELAQMLAGEGLRVPRPVRSEALTIDGKTNFENVWCNKGIFGVLFVVCLIRA